jgi:hypothetical protein
MALNVSGAISLAGTTVGQSIACELGCSGTGQIDINRDDARTLAGVASGQISFSSFYGKSSGPPPPTTLGQVYGGGYYTGVINAGVGCYYVSIAPIASGYTGGLRWKVTRTFTSGVGSSVDGYLNTWGFLNNADHPAGQYCATRSINGFADWYLPAINELKNLMYTNRGTLPGGEGGYAGTCHWSSTIGSSSTAQTVNFANGVVDSITMTGGTRCLRAVRRTPV